jgi:hypothetical protein
MNATVVSRLRSSLTSKYSHDYRKNFKKLVFLVFVKIRDVTDFVRKLRDNNIPIGRVCSILGVHGSESAIPIHKEVVSSLCA